MTRFHSSYDFLYQVLPVDVEIITLDLVGNAKYSVQLFAIPFAYFYIFMRMLTSRNNKYFVREFNNFATIVFLMVVFFRRNIQIYLNCNHNCKSEAEFLKRRDALKKFNLHLVQFEYKNSRNGFYFPCVNFKQNKIAPLNGALTIGIVGRYREEKGVDELLDVLQRFIDLYESNGNHVRVILGSDKDKRNSHQHPSIEYFCTESFAKYSEFIGSLDVAILNYDKAYSFRTSGVLNDLIQSNVICLVPNHSLLRHQVSWPVKVGYHYENIYEIPEILNALKGDKIYQFIRENFNIYNKKRSLDLLRLNLKSI